MNPEDRLREATKAYADPIQPVPDAWARIRERVDAEPRRHRVPVARIALAGFATAVVITLVVTLVTVVREDGDSGTGVTVGPSGERPDQIVAVTEDGRVLVLDASTGAEIRTLATSADAGSRVAVTPDGRRVFFDRSANAPSGCSGSRQIVGVPLSGGEPELVAGAASEPAISPDGRLLAFLSHQGPDGCSVPQSLVVRPVDAGPSGRQWTLPGGQGQYLTRPSWAPDSRHLAFVIAESEQPEVPRVLDTETAQALADAQPLGLAENVGWAGYLGRGGDFLGAVLPPGYGITDDTFEVVALDENGQVARELFSATGTVSDPFLADPSGMHVLIRTGPDGDSESLYRWTEGDEGLTKIADGSVVAAAWLPERMS